MFCKLNTRIFYLGGLSKYPLQQFLQDKTFILGQKIKSTEETARVHQGSLLYVFHASKTRPAIQS